jgi:hypothetical protein
VDKGVETLSIEGISLSIVAVAGFWDRSWAGIMRIGWQQIERMRKGSSGHLRSVRSVIPILLFLQAIQFLVFL